ncbi:class I SAM-dependent methyltransferase [Pseudodonghicola flavimaris]|uniref:TylF/MycF/NovP-related O-methyltransferase n=1 Tax=Pseudodonghicola flavimaris TaxID=3050036 RepID=A0ABT7EW30_9RHOB|nr:TylF/MycF/NovP-related O-methyltransferase [Pseudodonghicola flavimaris]MDK3016490.1 TylF/MycF/NovP-related O-methyltransferase [Pseudodonghicola flavimaris]
MKGQEGGSWDRQTHEKLYGQNLNSGLGDFIARHVQPRNMLEFGSGICALAKYVSDQVPLEPSYCLEPDVVLETPLDNNLNLLNVNVLTDPPPRVLDQLFDMVLSIEVAEHVPADLHEALFDFLVARAGRLIVFSAARPGQGGHGHVAERPELEWRGEFTRRGCRFDPHLTLLARNMSNRRNINHRRNLQVFHAPERSAELLALEERARPYLQDLLSIVLRMGKQFTGNLFYVALKAACAGRPEHSLHWKRENLRRLAADAGEILEVGFAAGHSALLMLLANPTSRLTIVDPLEFVHTRACFKYLDAMFPGRLELIEGYSTDVLPRLPKEKYDLVHLDGGKEKTIAADLELLRPLVARDHVLCIDDTQNAALNAEVNRWIAAGRLETGGFEEMIAASHRARWTHAIARYGVEEQDRNGKVLAEMRRIYARVNHPSIYTDGSAEGAGRADYLIRAMRDVEAQGLSGAFVEVGVAAGHSCVIAGLSASRQFPRDFYLYDTFAGFLPGLPDEVDLNGVAIGAYDLRKYKAETCSAPEVRSRVEAAGVAPDHLFLIEGPAEQTVPGIAPEKIAILRIDADLFAPTDAALARLYDLVEPGGYVIIDGYGHWTGCARAVDDFFAARGMATPGEKIDYSCIGWRK